VLDVDSAPVLAEVFGDKAAVTVVRFLFVTE
jgi:hypothetical protein